jgi:hypothetical protein
MRAYLAELRDLLRIFRATLRTCRQQGIRLSRRDATEVMRRVRELQRERAG